MTRKIAVIFLFFGICLQAAAQEMPPKIQSIIKQTMGVNGGYLTQQMHHEFWQEMHAVGTPSEIQLMKKSIDVGVVEALEYQKELWVSAKISYQNSRGLKTQRLIELESELPIKFGESLPFFKNSTEYLQAMSGYKQSMQVGIENSKRMLSAAANHTSMTSVQGQVIPIDMVTIDAAIKNMDASFQRLKNLLNENWVDKQGD